MTNSRMTPKERGLLKGAVRRVFSRSDLRRKIIQTVIINHSDPNRPRVKKWGRCTLCKLPTALYQMQVDHKDPIIPIDKTLEDMMWDEVINRAWCEENNLVPVCKPCHQLKTKEENKQRRKNKKTGV